MASAQMHVTGTVENPLCGRLQQKFSGRGAAAVSAKCQTQEISRVDGKIAKTVNPFEETAEFVPAGKRTAVQTKTRTQQTVSAKATPLPRSVRLMKRSSAPVHLRELRLFPPALMRRHMHARLLSVHRQLLCKADRMRLQNKQSVQKVGCFK